MASQRSSRVTRSALAVLALVLIGGAAYFAWPSFTTQKEADAATKPDPVPVSLAVAERSTVPVYLDSLGTVQPLNTVLVRSRVDGPIVSVAFKEGQMVKAGDLLVQIDPRPFQAQLDQATAKKAQDEATLANAKLDLQRFQTLVESENASRQQRDTQVSLVQQLTAQVAGDQAAIDSARLQLEYASIRAPITGRASFNLVTLGNIVHAADTNGIVTIAQLQPISVIFTEPEERLPAISSAFAAGSVPVIAMSSDGKQTLARGVLSVLNNQIDVASGTIQLKATFDNADNALWPGLSVTTRLLVQTLQDAVVVPDTAVQRGPDGFFVFVVDRNNKATKRDVALGPFEGGRAVIAKGIEPGDRVISDGQYRVANGIEVADLSQPGPANNPVSKAVYSGPTPPPIVKD